LGLQDKRLIMAAVDTLAGVKVQVSASLIMNTLFGFQDTAYCEHSPSRSREHL
jgi:hypothetical protein